ncbi:uncharacterized protein LOC144373846 [Ictidomys tridecemlineatus]
MLQHEDVDNFELLRMMSENEKIKVPDHSLVYLSMNPGIKYFIMRKRPEVKGKEFSESTCKSSRPLSHKQVGDTCLIHVHLETQSPKMAKKVLVSLGAGVSPGAYTWVGGRHWSNTMEYSCPLALELLEDQEDRWESRRERSV